MIDPDRVQTKAVAMATDTRVVETRAMAGMMMIIIIMIIMETKDTTATGTTKRHATCLGTPSAGNWAGGVSSGFVFASVFPMTPATGVGAFATAPATTSGTNGIVVVSVPTPGSRPCTVARTGHGVTRTTTG